MVYCSAVKHAQRRLNKTAILFISDHLTNRHKHGKTQRIACGHPGRIITTLSEVVKAKKHTQHTHAHKDTHKFLLLSHSSLLLTGLFRKCKLLFELIFKLDKTWQNRQASYSEKNKIDEEDLKTSSDTCVVVNIFRT